MTLSLSVCLPADASVVMSALIQYGIDRKYNANETHTALIYNMGATSTKGSRGACARKSPLSCAFRSESLLLVAFTVSLATFSGYPDRVKKNKTVGQFEVKAVAWDETLGSCRDRLLRLLSKLTRFCAV